VGEDETQREVVLDRLKADLRGEDGEASRGLETNLEQRRTPGIP
jgi:hypothetical protein